MPVKCHIVVPAEVGENATRFRFSKRRVGDESVDILVQREIAVDLRFDVVVEIPGNGKARHVAQGQ